MQRPGALKVSSRAERFAEAVRLGLEKRDAEKGIFQARGSSQPEIDLRDVDGLSAADVAQHIGSSAGRSRSGVAAESSKDAGFARDDLSHVVVEPSRHGVGETVGQLGMRLSEKKRIEGADGNVELMGASVYTRQMTCTSVFDDDEISAVQYAESRARPLSRASGSGITQHVDCVPIDDDSDRDCIDLTNEETGEAAGRLEKVCNVGQSSGAGPSESREERWKCNSILGSRQYIESTTLPAMVPNMLAKEVTERESELNADANENDDGEPASKRRKKVKEKRGAKYRSAPSKAALDRLERSAGHRLFLVDKSIEKGQISCAVMGTNGNLYKCCIDLTPICNCQDFLKREDTKQQGPCKHLIFIFMRVLKLDQDDHRWWQKCLLPSELEDLHSIAQGNVIAEPGVLAEESVIVEYQKAKSQETDETGRRPLEGECTVCYEDLVPADRNMRPENVTTFCKECGNNFHSACLDNWFRAQENRTCPLCRSIMGEGGDKADGNAGSYLNLSQHSSAHERHLTLAELYADTHMYIGRGRRGHGRGRKTISTARGRRHGQGG